MPTLKLAGTVVIPVAPWLGLIFEGSPPVYRRLRPFRDVPLKLVK
jgi:hypothetical protein